MFLLLFFIVIKMCNYIMEYFPSWKMLVLLFNIKKQKIIYANKTFHWMCLKVSYHLIAIDRQSNTGYSIFFFLNNAMEKIFALGNF